MTVLGTDGYIETRKYVDIGGRIGSAHIFLADQKAFATLKPKMFPLPYGEQLVDDVINRTETAMSQEHCFLATQLAVQAQRKAHKIAIKNSIQKEASPKVV